MLFNPFPYLLTQIKQIMQLKEENTVNLTTPLTTPTDLLFIKLIDGQYVTFVEHRLPRQRRGVGIGGA